MDILYAFLGSYQGILGMSLDVSKRSLSFHKDWKYAIPGDSRDNPELDSRLQTAPVCLVSPVNCCWTPYG